MYIKKSRWNAEQNPYRVGHYRHEYPLQQSPNAMKRIVDILKWSPVKCKRDKCYNTFESSPMCQQRPFCSQ